MIQKNDGEKESAENKKIRLWSSRLSKLLRWINYLRSLVQAAGARGEGKGQQVRLGGQEVLEYLL